MTAGLPLLEEELTVDNRAIRMNVCEKVFKIVKSLLIRWHHLRRNSDGHVWTVVIGQVDFIVFHGGCVGKCVLLVCDVRCYACQWSQISQRAFCVAHRQLCDQS